MACWQCCHWSRSAHLVLVLRLVWQAFPAAGYVCQLMTQENAPLQSVLGVTCEVADGACNCTTSLVDGVQWVLIDQGVNATLQAREGYWYVTDPSGRCVAGGAGGVIPLEQPCPPGFYCLGGHAPPRSCNGGDYCPGRKGGGDRRCPKGHFCPIPGGVKLDCPDGANCPPGQTQPQACAPGNFCRGGEMMECPLGSYCPFATIDPRTCFVLAMCPAGSKSQGVWPFSMSLMLVVACAFLAGAQYYDRISQRGIWVFCVCVICVSAICFIDIVLAGFLLLLFTLVSANWALLRWGSVHPLVDKILVVITLGAALTALWYVNPPWALLIGGLAVFAGLGYLMSRQNRYLVFLGRVLLFVAFCALIVGFWLVDSQFMQAVVVCLVAIGFALLFSWFLESRTQGRPARLPFQTHRWTVGGSPIDSDSPPGSASRIARRAAAESPRSALEPPAPTGGAATGNAAVSTTTGVSFQLERVNFELPDGKRLLSDVSLGIAPGRRVAVMGPSGSGKSTLLAVLSGRASYGIVTGRLSVSGHQAGDLRFLRSVTGFVPQDDVLHGELSVQENVRFQAALRLPSGTTDCDIECKVKEVARALNLEGHLAARVGTPEQRGISGGQRKRVSIAMELVAQPLLLFADEPTSGLDSTTSHDVVSSLNEAAADLGTTVIAVIHQPRYDTLKLFDDLVLLGFGGCLVYAGPTDSVVTHFSERLGVDFPPHANPADVLLDSIQNPEDVANYCQRYADYMEPLPSVKASSRRQFDRNKVPFFRATLIYMDRSMLQSLRAAKEILINQCLCVATTYILCFILKYERLDQFMMQSTLAALFLMLLQGVAAQRIFGRDLLITWREARVGMPMVAYFTAKDLASLFEVTLSAAVFTVTYGTFSGCLQQLQSLFAGSWAFVYCVYGMSYIFSIVLSPGAAQMSAVVSSFVAFCMSGIYQPQLPEMASMFNGRGWMIPALSPVRWFYGYMLTKEAHFLTKLTTEAGRGMLQDRGYDLNYLNDCVASKLGIKDSDDSTFTLRQAWMTNRGWVCSVAQMLLLGIIFRFLAGLCLTLQVQAQTSGWARFFGQSEHGASKLAGNLFTLLLGSFLFLFLLAEIWIFGMIRLHVPDFMPFPAVESSLLDSAIFLS